MPAEWHPHQRCWMAWPTNAAAYLGRIEACRVTWANVARAIARFEPVVMLPTTLTWSLPARFAARKSRSGV